MDGNQPVTISLTGPNSHTVKIPPGQGSFSIGINEMLKKDFDVIVDNSLPVNWTAFDEFKTPAGSPWPRFIYYWGDDTGFIEWSKKRAIEDFFWRPNKSVSIDLNNAQISRLSIQSNENRITLALGNKIGWLNLLGNLENFDLTQVPIMPNLNLCPNTAKANSATSYRLPQFKTLKEITSLDVKVEPLGQAFDCESLLQFPGLLHLNLTGNITNVHCLAKLENLESIGIRYAPALEGFPSLNTFKKLKSFIGWNIEENAGKRLNTELKNLSKERELDHSSVSKLRSPIWFTTEYGIPFSNWDEKNAKVATKAYKTALKEILKSKAEDGVKEAVARFIEVINKLPNIETTEREDAAIAVEQLVAASTVKIPREKANKWFDENRDF